MKYRMFAPTVMCAVTVILTGLTIHEASARLASAKLADLIDDSTLIVEAAPVKIERTGSQAGSARLKVLRVVSGTYKSDHIEIAWGDEVHDQSIDSIDFDRLLFLKKNADGKFEGTQYGRSYWPLTSRVTDVSKADLNSSQRTMRYEYPLTMVKFTAAEKRQLLSGSGKDQAVQMKQLVEYIAKRKAKKKK